MTKELANAVGPNGNVVALDKAKKDIAIAKKRMRCYENVSISTVPSYTALKIDPVDCAVSIGATSSFEKVTDVLKQINKKMKKGGKICFLEYDRFFWILPNIAWISSNKQITSKFKDAGFSVSVKRKHGLLWQYIYIFGEKK